MYRLVQLHNLTTIDHAKRRNDKINACENTRLNKLLLSFLDKKKLKNKIKFNLVSDERK